MTDQDAAVIVAVLGALLGMVCAYIYVLIRGDDQ